MSTSHEHGGNVFAVARSLGLPPEKIVDFSASINPLGMAPGVPAALAGCLDRLLHYPDKGAAELKEALAAYHGVSPQEIAVANGSTELIHLLPRVVAGMGGGRKGLIVAPAFAEYAMALVRAGWQIDYFTLDRRDNFSLQLPALKEKLSKGYDLLFICNPGNPTGTLIPKPLVAEIVQLCGESGTFLALDEAFIDFCEEESAKDLVRGLERGVVLRSMTKFFAIPGLRLGFALGAPGTIEAIASLQDPWSVNTAAQVAGIASLQDEVYCTRTRNYVSAERQFLMDSLAGISGLKVYPARANYLLVELLNGMKAPELRAELLKKGVLIRDCSNFHGLDDRFFRVAVRLREENELLLENLGKALSTGDSLL
ncbi:threonine-phosphate decarboxylase CobD [Geomonas sp.]|uniref:threonine-phosphate decarboxylase CobD n=1 Tax=Geomonas sp. TaxID=2651584 RepID=UPI002B4865FE|nr:threonine-phosphate decarboxylase CobD [Geomonas sp.]HJV34419.1 threonine-phosphate decarboxylase CobD [Geomonas sp.]